MKQKIFLSLFFIPIILCGIALSIWQYQRSIWKEKLLAEYTTQLSQKPTPLPTLVIRSKGDKNSILGKNNDLFKNLELIPVILTGHFLFDTVFYRPTHNGMDLIVAFETDDGIIPVNAGTMPHTAKDLLIQDILPPIQITIEGFYRLPKIDNTDTPKNKALVVNIPFNAFYKNYKNKMLVGAVQLNTKVTVGKYLTGYNGTDFIKNIPNNHIQYMGTWILLSVVALVVYALIFIKIKK